MTRRTVLPVFIFLVLVLPFIGRPWLFDDPSVVITAEAAAAHPLHPYNYRLDLGRPDQLVWTPGGLPGYTYPPLSTWLMGGVLRITGNAPWPLHLFMFIVSAFLLIFYGRLALEFTTEASLAVFWLGLSPVLFLTSLTLYPQPLYSLLAMFCWLSAFQLLKIGRWRWAVALGISLAAAALTIHQWPLLVFILICVFLSRMGGASKPPAWLITIGVFVLLYGAWCAWEIHGYGMTHLGAAWRVRTAGPPRSLFIQLLPCVFFAGALPCVGIGWIVLARKSPWLVGALAFLSATLFVVMAGPQGGFSGVQALLFALLFGTGAAFLISLVFLYRTSTAADRLLIGWFAVEFLFLQKFLTLPAGRHILGVALPAVLLCVRAQELLQLRRRWIAVGSVFLCAWTLALAEADISIARIGPRVAADLKGIQGTRYVWGNDYSGFTYYLKKDGWLAYDPEKALRPGEYLLIGRNLNAQGPPFFLPKSGLRLEGVRTYRISSPLRTFSIGDSAGWYSASWGALPYSASWAPAETFYLYTRT